MIHYSCDVFNSHSSKLQINSVVNNRRVPSAAVFEISTLESTEEDQIVDAVGPVQYNNFEVLWIQKGGGVIVIDLQRHKICDNMIICIYPGQRSLINATGNIVGYRISFSRDFLLQAEGQTVLSFTDACYNSGNVNIFFPDKAMQQELNDIVRLMYKEFKNYFLQRSQILKGFFNIFLFHLLSNIKTTAPHNVQERDAIMVRKFMTLIKEHFLTKKMVSDYANELFVSPNYLNIIVKKVTGYTASHHIQQLIILEAKRQAMYSGLSMKEIAYSLGFNDYAHFSKFFKNNSGMNFTCFKNRLYEMQ